MKTKNFLIAYFYNKRFDVGFEITETHYFAWQNSRYKRLKVDIGSISLEGLKWSLSQTLKE